MNNNKRKIVFVILALCGMTGFVFAQSFPPRIEKLRNEISIFTYSNQYDSAQHLVVKFLEQKDISDTEIFYGHFLFADVVKASGRPGEAIPMLLESKKYLEKVGNRTTFESLIYGNVAECYFTLMDYPNAKKNALLSLQTNPGVSLRSGGHAVNYIIIGYCDYIDKKYNSSIDYYNRAIKEYRAAGEYCELPLCYTKMAKVNNTMGNSKLAEENITKAIAISDSCKIEAYKLLSMRTMFDIYYENKNYEKALGQLMIINNIVGKIENEKQGQLIGELEVKYQTKLMQSENEALRKINEKNNELLEEQKQTLLITSIALLIMAILIVLLIWFAGQKKKAEQKLAGMNLELERKVNDRTMHLLEANEKIRENTDLLTFQNKQLMDFCNIVSHNLKSPLVNMTMLVKYIEESKDVDDQRKMIEKLKPVINNLNLTFDELLESLQVKQDIEIKSEKIFFQDCLERTLEGLEADIIKSKAEINGDFYSAPSIHYPSKYLYSIFHNLVSNAIKYRAPDRKTVIRIKTQRTDDSIILSVKDNGLGIDLEKNKDNLFKIRKVFHNHPDARGFGLYLTKTQIETMNGRIWAESEPGNGSVFFVEFKNPN